MIDSLRNLIFFKVNNLRPPNQSVSGVAALVVAEFDQIADVYDETRRPLDEETVKGMKEMLAKHSCHSILEIGVGTGRVSLPLSHGGFEMTGVDISVRMMERASAKGLKNLVLAVGNQVPFADRTFDAAIMAHVFHLLEDPVSVLRESARVSKVGVFALVRKGPRGERWQGFFGPFGSNIDSQSTDQDEQSEETRKFIEERRQYFRELGQKYGWKPDLTRQRNWAREQEILETYPPDDLKVVSDTFLNESLEDRINRFQKAGYSFMSSMPEAMREEIISDMRARAAKFPERAMQPRREVYQLAMWKPETLVR
jgi:SAM-dependent methyltransferase